MHNLESQDIDYIKDEREKGGDMEIWLGTRYMQGKEQENARKPIRCVVRERSHILRSHMGLLGTMHHK